MACGGFNCSKNALIALNILYIFVAFILIIAASVGKAQAVYVSLKILGGIVACGVFLLLVALIGLVGAVKHHQVLLFFYMLILFVIFLAQFATACACLAINKDQQQQFALNVWKSTPDSEKTNMQIKLNCCGFTDPNNINNSSSAEGHPPCQAIAACENSSVFCCSGNHTNGTLTETPPEGPCPADPCWTIIEKHMDEATKTSGGIGLFFSFTEIIGVWLALRYRNLKDPRANPSAFL